MRVVSVLGECNVAGVAVEDPELCFSIEEADSENHSLFCQSISGRK